MRVMEHNWRSEIHVALQELQWDGAPSRVNDRKKSDMLKLMDYKTSVLTLTTVKTDGVFEKALSNANSRVVPGAFAQLSLLSK